MRELAQGVKLDTTYEVIPPRYASATVALLRAGTAEVECLVLSDAVIVLDTTEGIAVLTDPTVTEHAAEQRPPSRSQRGIS